MNANLNISSNFVVDKPIQSKKLIPRSLVTLTTKNQTPILQWWCTNYVCWFINHRKYLDLGLSTIYLSLDWLRESLQENSIFHPRNTMVSSIVPLSHLKPIQLIYHSYVGTNGLAIITSYRRWTNYSKPCNPTTPGTRNYTGSL